MFDISNRDGPKPRCYFNQTKLPTFVDHAQPSTKKRPFSTVLGQTYNSLLDVILPANATHRFQEALAGEAGTLRYAKVHMKLSEILAGEFFNQCIKSGNILMLSEGRSGIDHVFSLANGILRLEVDKATYERMGLQGKSIPTEGRKHVKARFAIGLNLRLPSMVQGHKGFERILWACRNVLNHSVTWLFCDLQSRTDGSGPIAAHQPLTRTVEPQAGKLGAVSVPTFPDVVDETFETEAVELLEWLTMVAALSPRIRSEDAIDTYLCRYRVPDLTDGDGPAQSAQEVTRFRWHGFMPASFITKILLAALKASADDWFALSATSFHGEAYTILKTNDSAMTWEYID